MSGDSMAGRDIRQVTRDNMVNDSTSRENMSSDSITTKYNQAEFK